MKNAASRILKPVRSLVSRIDLILWRSFCRNVKAGKRPGTGYRIAASLVRASIAILG